ncbi:AtpZ/AtpI family protein [Xanthovirga aplysinae]|uniref:AtpZ/AtpI family protein n=1 Tax=Xanthovirga aplysinae TaxID=2529853 RepID=UPI0031B62F6C
MKKAPKKKVKQTQKQFDQYLRYSGLAFQMMATISIGVWGGIKIDEWMGNEFPIFTVVFSLLAIVGAIVSVIKSLPEE